MDETNFVHASLGGYPNESFIAKQLHGVPILIISYIGALKSWLFAPIFHLFGISVLTVRLPAIALSAVTLILSYWCVRPIVSRWPAVALVAVMATSAAFAVMSKVDWSPMVIAMLLKITAVGSFFRLIERRELRWLFVLFASFLLGVFNKLDFLWIVEGMTAGGLVVYFSDLLSIVRRRLTVSLSAIGAFVILFGIYSIKGVGHNLAGGGAARLYDPLPHLNATWHTYQLTVVYSGVLRFFTDAPTAQPWWLELMWVPTAAIVVAALVVLLTRPMPPATRIPARATAFLFIMAAVIFLDIAATGQPALQHVVDLWPLPVMVVITGGTALARSGIAWQRPAVLLAGLALIGNFVAQGLYTANYVSVMRDPAELRSVFSTDVYRDAAFLSQHTAAVNEVLSAGWGPGTPLFALACPNERAKYNDVEWHTLVEMRDSGADGLVRKAFGDQRVLVLALHSPDLPPSEVVNMVRLRQAYVQDFPDNSDARVLTTNAYDIYYFGPGSLGPNRSPCSSNG